MGLSLRRQSPFLSLFWKFVNSETDKKRAHLAAQFQVLGVHGDLLPLLLLGGEARDQDEDIIAELVCEGFQITGHVAVKKAVLKQQTHKSVSVQLPASDS